MVFGEMLADQRQEFFAYVGGHRFVEGWVKPYYVPLPACLLFSGLLFLHYWFLVSQLERVSICLKGVLVVPFGFVKFILCAGYGGESLVYSHWYLFDDIWGVVGVDIDVERGVIWFPVRGMALSVQVQVHIQKVN